jgi:hypothetical protein
VVISVGNPTALKKATISAKAKFPLSSTSITLK